MTEEKAYGICKKCGKEAVHLAMSGLIDFHGDQDDDLDNESIYADEILLPDDVRVGIHACFECGHVEDVWVEEPHENKTIKRLMAENKELEANLSDALATSKASLDLASRLMSKKQEQVAEIARLQMDLKKEHQTACDLFVVIAEIAQLVGIERSEPEICRKTVAAVKRLVLAYEWLQHFHKVHRKAMAWFGRVPRQESEKEVNHYSEAFGEVTAVSANVRTFLEETS